MTADRYDFKTAECHEGAGDEFAWMATNLPNFFGAKCNQ
jgi:hypothetical protein